MESDEDEEVVPSRRKKNSYIELGDLPEEDKTGNKLKDPLLDEEEEDGTVYQTETVRPTRWMRWLLLGLVAAVVITGSIAGTVVGLGRSRRRTSSWWETAVLYEIFPASFRDSDGDGFGDLAGLIDRLDYVVDELGVTALRLSGVVAALDFPLEHRHVIEFSAADPHLGPLAWTQLTKAARQRGLKVILDLPLGRTSDEHTWAAHWLQRRTPAYQHFYLNSSDCPGQDVEERGGGDNDTITPRPTFGGYLCLNLSDRGLRSELRVALREWRDRGVDGFYLRDLPGDETWDFGRGYGPILAATGDVDLQERAPPWLDPNPIDIAPLWSLGDCSSPRLASRHPGRGLAHLFLLLALPGPVSFLYGEELGLRDAVDPDLDKRYLRGQLCPMAWDDRDNASLWMPAHPDDLTEPRTEQRRRAAVVKDLIKLRKAWEREPGIPQMDRRDGFVAFHPTTGWWAAANLGDLPVELRPPSGIVQLVLGTTHRQSVPFSLQPGEAILLRL